MAAAYWGTFGAIHASANPAALFLGDSWFWYPPDNLPLEIGKAFPHNGFLVIGKSGAVTCSRICWHSCAPPNRSWPKKPSSRR